VAAAVVMAVVADIEVVVKEVAVAADLVVAVETEDLPGSNF
jgi:hypothetical protein